MEKDDSGIRRFGWLPDNNQASRNDASAAKDNAPLPWLKGASPSAGRVPVRNTRVPEVSVPIHEESIPHIKKTSLFHTMTKFPLLFAIIGVIAVGSMTAAMPTLATLDFDESTPPPTNVDSQAFVVSRTRFDPTSTVTVNGATAVGASAVFTQVVKANFLAEMGDIVTVNNIRVENLGSTNAIASIEVIAPSGVSVDVRSPSGAGNELRLLGPNVFALPIDAASSAEIELRMIILTGPLDPGTSQQFSIQVEVSGLD